MNVSCYLLISLNRRTGLPCLVLSLPVTAYFLSPESCVLEYYLPQYFVWKLPCKVQFHYCLFLSYSVAETQTSISFLRGSKNSSGISFKLSFQCFVCSILQDFELSLDQPASIGELCPEDKSLHSQLKWKVTHTHIILHWMLCVSTPPHPPCPPTWMLLFHSLCRSLGQTIIHSLFNSKDSSELSHMKIFLALYIALCHIHGPAGVHNQIWLKGAEPMK